VIFDEDDLKSIGSLPDGQEGCPAQLGDDSFLLMISGGIFRQFTFENGEYQLHNFTLPVARDDMEVAQLLNGDAFVVTKGNSMAIHSVDGKLLMTDSLQKGHGFQNWNVANARDSMNFAFETDHSPLLPTLAFETGFVRVPVPVPDHLAVYSLNEKRMIFTIKLRGIDDQYALSPDGSLSATLSNGWVRVYKVP
jgi:hypothetical protein